MTPLRRMLLEVYDAPTPLLKARAIEALLQELEAEIGSARTLEKATGRTSLVSRFADLGQRLDNLAPAIASRAQPILTRSPNP